MGKKKNKDKKDESTLNKQLLKYSLAASTALAMAQPAGAEVICSSPGNGIINEGQTGLGIDLDNDGQPDFSFSFSVFTTGPDQLKTINAAGINHPSNAFVGSFGAGYAPNVNFHRCIRLTCSQTRGFHTTAKAY